jgi:hypothetical protein
MIRIECSGHSAVLSTLLLESLQTDLPVPCPAAGCHHTLGTAERILAAAEKMQREAGDQAKRNREEHRQRDELDEAIRLSERRQALEGEL